MMIVSVWFMLSMMLIGCLVWWNVLRILVWISGS